MPLLDIKLDATELLKDIKGLRERTSNVAKEFILKRGKDFIREAVFENFVQQGRPWKWAPLADSTIRKRTKRGTWPGDILIEFGTLLDRATGDLITRPKGQGVTYSFTYPKRVVPFALQYGVPPSWTPGMRWKTVSSGPTKKVRQNVKEYKRKQTMVFGKKIRRNTVVIVRSHGRTINMRIPPRPFFLLTNKDVRDISEKLLDFVILGKK